MCKYYLILRSILGILPNGSINHACIIHELPSLLRDICDFCVKDFFTKNNHNKYSLIASKTIIMDAVSPGMLAKFRFLRPINSFFVMFS